MSARVPSTVRKTAAWYWPGLGVGRPAGLQALHTERPAPTRSPQRTHLSYKRFTIGSLGHPGRRRRHPMTGIA
ncbi:MAG: hypothetical protein QOE25_34 [Actinomycetota bacterium]|jgi:hypothetical protein|nr:hypothetical protein [Actinomycetota bacterium]